MNSVKLVTRNDKPEAAQAAHNLEALLSAHDIDAGGDAFDAVIAIGGDGTVLEAAAIAVEHHVPICGVNVGRVGYLAEFPPSEIADLVAAIASDSYTLRRHATIEVSIGERAARAINDVVVEKVISQRIIEVSVEVNHKPLATYRTDGMIVATPLGSTAYSLSAGGPIIDPAHDAFVLTPVAPHSLLTRSVVLGPDAVVTLTVSGDRPARINVDGREFSTVEPNEPITIQRGTDDVEFLTLDRHPFPDALRQHFGLEHA